MSVSNDELMKKLEEFMIQQTQNTNELKTSTNDLKAAVETLQSKKAAIEDGLQAQSQNKTYKQGEDQDSEDICFEGGEIRGSTRTRSRKGPRVDFWH
ncbi:unnamed protein product [Lactuca virosa]|uniref:Uncharacterized protein n=1 Tax=Lactuca virosa TaxID=75947 RepID=A0AAU9NUX5_9ASTR|nr:unnamed protein product [Lactuca virosa]